MSERAPDRPRVVPMGARPAALLAEFESPRELLSACRRLRAEGFRRWDAHTPFPIHGLDAAMGLGSSPLGWFVLAGGLGGAAAGLALQWWVSAVAYPLNVAGKPLFSWPAFVPVTFELGVLGGALGAVAGLLLLARLPRLHHPLFASARFERASDDRFFVSIDSSDPGFELAATKRLLRELGARHVEEIE